MDIWYSPGIGSNNISKFIAIITLLAITLEKGVTKLEVMGDSKLVIDWALHKFKVENVCLGPLLQDI
jgi:ribonuclease HI